MISTWINEVDLCLKTYDIVSLERHPRDFSCQSIHNESCQVVQNVEQVRILMNPRGRHKTLACLIPQTAQPDKSDAKPNEEMYKVRAPNYNSDHRDSLADRKIPYGYKIIGVRGFKNTNDGAVLHIADFIIWKPRVDWLKVLAEGYAELEAISHRNIGDVPGGDSFGRRRRDSKYYQNWISAAESGAEPKNFIRINHERLKVQQAALTKLREQ